MPRVSNISSISKASATLAACAEAVSESANGLSNGLSSLSRIQKTYSGFGEGVCTCARCMRRAGPIREDVENKLVQITYALANVYDDSPDLEVKVTDDHRARAEQMMACVESGDVPVLRDLFLEIEEQESDGILEGGTATEIATYLIISAAQVGQADIIRLLAEWDADMEETDSIRRGRPLMHAANNGHTAAVKAMTECGADPEATDDNGYTALMVAVFSDRSSAAEVLVDGGACVDAQDRAGRTALSYAAMYGSTDCIYLLASRGADVAHVDHDGNTPLELAEGSGRQSAVDALKKLQLRVKMQEKRKVKASKCRGGCSDLDAAALEAKEAEAARAAAELLEQLEKEEAAKSAKAAKKKKKGKGKHLAAEAETSETQQQETELLGAALEGLQSSILRQRRQQQQQQQQRHSMSNGSSSTAEWPSQGVRLGHEDSATSKAVDGGHPRKQPQQLAVTSPSAPGYAVDASHSHALQNGHTGGDDAGSTGDGAAALGSVDSAAHLDELRHEWEALLEQAARCKDRTQQPTLLARVTEMLQHCSDAGISVKYGRKVLQRLQAVEPARRALQSALSAQPCVYEELEAALSACKICRCMLEDDLVQVAEDVMANLIKERAEHKQQQQVQQQRQLEQQQEQQRVQQERLRQQHEHRQQQAKVQQEQQQRQREQQLKQQQIKQQQSRQQQQQQRPKAAALVANGVAGCHSAQSGSPSHAEQAARTQWPQQPQQQVADLHQQRLQQQQVVSPRAVQAPVPPVAQPGQSQPPTQQYQPQHPGQHVQQQKYHSMHSPPPQQPLPAVTQQQAPSMPSVSMPYLQQQQYQAQHIQQQTGKPLLQPQVRQVLSKSPQPVPVSSGPAAPPGGMPSLHQQHHPFSQLQLLQHQQQLFTSQLQGSRQQQLGFGQVQRQLAGVLGGSGLHQSLVSPSPVGTPPNMIGSPGMHQMLPPASQAAVRMQQRQQQLGNTYWPPSQPSLVPPGPFGSVGSGPAPAGRLSLDMLAPGPGLTGRTGGLGPGDLTRRGSLGSAVLTGQTDVDVLDDLMHPAYAMANAVLSDDEHGALEPVLVNCTVCQKARRDTCCLPCGCLLMCQGCAGMWRQRGEGICPFCKSHLDDFAVV